MKKTKRLAAALLTIMAVSTACVAPPKEDIDIVDGNIEGLS